MNLLLISTVSCILEYLIPAVIEHITTYLYSRKKFDVQLHNDLISIKHEMISISMVDEFSKYAKLQRKYIKLENVLKDKVNKQMTSRLKARLFITYGFRILYGTLVMVLLYLYKSEPVIVLPKDTLWPINYFLRWPSWQEDSISLIVWFVIARLAISKCKKIDLSNKL